MRIQTRNPKSLPVRQAGEIRNRLAPWSIPIRNGVGSHYGYSTGHGGFTLIELLLVLVILGTLAAIVVPKFAGRTEQARVTATQSQISTFGTALDAFEVDNGYYPKTIQDLIVQPGDAQNWKGPYLKNEIPLDPWGSAYIYEYPGKHSPSGYDLYSIGPDKREGTDDDITSWQLGTQKKQ